MRRNLIALRTGVSLSLAALVATISFTFCMTLMLVGASVSHAQDEVPAVSVIHSVSAADDECVTVAKDLNSLVADSEGQPVTWCAKVTNTGNTALADVILQLPDLAGDDIDVLDEIGSAALLPGESAVVSVEGLIPTPGLVSRAGVRAQPSDADGVALPGLDVVQDDDNATAVEASIDLRATAIAGPNGDCSQAGEVVEVLAGGDVTWCYAVTNTGSVTLQVTNVVDSVLGLTIPIPAANQPLSIAATVAVSVDTIASESQVTAATVSGQPLGFDDSVLDVAPVEDSDGAQLVVLGRLGDVDCNDQVDALDALLIAQFVAGIVTESACPFVGAGELDLSRSDVNQDGFVQNDDAQALLDCLVTPAGCE